MRYALCAMRLSPTAFFVFFAAAAGARLIATDFGSFFYWLSFRASSCISVTQENWLLLGFFQLLCFFLGGHLNSEEHLNGLNLDSFYHLLKHLESFTLVLDEGILLSISTETDPFLEVIHGQQVLSPPLVHSLQGY
jgi:hypothetical protein